MPRMAHERTLTVAELFIENLPAHAKDLDIERTLRKYGDAASNILVNSFSNGGPNLRTACIKFSSIEEAEDALQRRIFRITDIQPEVEFVVAPTISEDQPSSLLKTTFGRLTTLFPNVFGAWEDPSELDLSDPELDLSDKDEDLLPPLHSKGIQTNISCLPDHERAEFDSLGNEATLNPQEAARIKSDYIQLQAKYDKAETGFRDNEIKTKAERDQLHKNQVKTQAVVERAGLHIQAVESILRQTQARNQDALDELMKLGSMHGELELDLARATERPRRTKADGHILEDERTSSRGEYLASKSQRDMTQLRFLLRAANERAASSSADAPSQVDTSNEIQDLQLQLDRLQESKASVEQELWQTRKDLAVLQAGMEEANRATCLAKEDKQKMKSELDELQAGKLRAEADLFRQNHTMRDLRGQFNESRLEASLLSTRIDLMEAENRKLLEDLLARKNREEKMQAEEVRRVRELHRCRIQLQEMQGINDALRTNLLASQNSIRDLRSKEEAMQHAHQDILNQCYHKIRVLQAEIEAERQRHKARFQREPFAGNTHSKEDATKNTSQEQTQEERHRAHWKKATQKERERCRERDWAWTSGPEKWSAGMALTRFIYVLSEFERMTFNEERPLTFEAIPWPVLLHPGSFNIQHVDWKAVEDFCNHLKSTSREESKALFKRIQFSFHPDKWRSRNILTTVMEEDLRKELEAAGNIVAQAVNGCQ